MLRKSLSILVAAGLFGSVVAPAVISPAYAQGMQTYLPRRLTGSDLAILELEAGKLGPDGPKQESWTNQETGNSGTVTFLSANTRQGMPCRKFRYTFVTGTANDGTPYTLNWCQKSDGQWAIAN